MMKRKKCKHEGCSNPVWSGGLCQNHIGKKPMKKIKTKIHYISKSGEEQLDKAIKAHMMHEFFMEIWKKRKHFSEVSGDRLGSEALSTYFHHILPKNKFYQAAFDPENIILLTPDEHGDVESDMFKYAEVNERRERLLKKYNLI